MSKAFTFFGAFLLIISIDLCAEEREPTKKFELGHTHIVSVASSSGIPYELIITLPSSYYESPDKYYPVLYYTDAYWDAPLLSSIYLDLNFDGLVPELILVGLSYPEKSTSYTTARRKDLTPTKDVSISPESGGGEAFLAFIKTIVVPKIESEYRVNHKERILAGWSYGGLFTLYAMYQDPDFFSRYIAISPSVPWDNGFIHRLDSEHVKAHKELNAKLFISYAKEESAAFTLAVATFQQQLENRKYVGLSLRNYTVDGIKHASGKAVGYTQGLAWVWTYPE